MKRYMIIAAIIAASMGALAAQNVCTINGTMGNRNLRFSNAEVTTVYLNQMDELENTIVVDSATVSPDGKFSFTYPLDGDAQPMVFLLTGFDNGAAHFWVEPGVVELNIADANYPAACKASGTVTNELEAQYNEIREKCIQQQVDSLKVFEKRYGAQWIDSEEGIARRTMVGSQAVLQQFIDKAQFILEHTDSPLAPLFMKKELMWSMSELMLTRIVRSMQPCLFNHPYYKSFKNSVLSRYMKEGTEIPDIDLHWMDGTQSTLSSLRGKYVLLDFWASWCGPCRKEIPHLTKLLQETVEFRDKFVIVSYSLDNKKEEWQKAVKDYTIDIEGWYHASDLHGWASPEANILGVTAVPKTFLISPDGKIIAMDLRGEELVRKVKMILAQDAMK